MDKRPIRLDKYLSDMGQGTRSKIKQMIRKGQVAINNNISTSPDEKVLIGKDKVCFKGVCIEYNSYVYYMLNKPQGYVSATKDNIHKTVIDIIKDEFRDNIFPVGRLDIDTEGLLLITNDGELAHNLLSPKKAINKTYYLEVNGRISDYDKEKLESGVYIDKSYLTLPAKVRIIETDDISKIELTIQEGKFHQVKQMINAVDKDVLYLKRISMGGLHLDPKLKLGDYRYLTDKEIDLLTKAVER
ncbi:MAG TPA: rRNA pseudouridine synthase [Clostridiales bacterium]|nr:rRNA pseudouridine synthase [Clostridiales bacterium]